jgi:hypothetical protein
MRLFLAITSILLLGGCGIAQHMDDRAHYRQSVADYRDCLAANTASPQQACESKRLIMETNERATNPHNPIEAVIDGDITVRNR